MAVIGCMLMAGPVEKNILDNMDPEWFYSERNRLIYKVLKQYIDTDTRTDLVLACQWLTNAEILGEIGGQRYLTDCMDKCSTLAHTESYITEMRKIYYDRQIIATIKEVEQDPSPDNIEKLRCKREEKDGANAQGILNLKDCGPKILELVSPLAKGMYDIFGFEQLNEYHNAAAAGDIICVGARPGVGKTVLSAHMAINFARVYKEPVLYFTTEMTYEEMLQRILAPLSGVPGWKFRKRYFDKEGNDATAIDKAAAELMKLNIFIVDKQSPTLAEIRAAMAATKARLVIVDYLQVLNLEVDDEGKPAAFGRFMYGWKHSLRGIGAVGVILSQLAREVDGLTSKQSPQMKDLKGSGDIEIASNCIVLAWPHNKKDKDTKDEVVPEIKNIKPVEFVFVKNRTGKSDVSVQMIFDENLICFHEWNTDTAMKFADQVIARKPKEKKNEKSKTSATWGGGSGDTDSGGFTPDPGEEQ